MKRYIPKYKQIFYVYEHWRPDKNLPFWVGKGKDKRAYEIGRNIYYNRIVAKLARLGMHVEIKMVANNLTEGKSLALEIGRIAFWRAKGVKLANLTNGGEGTSGLPHTEEWKRQQGIRSKIRMASPVEREKARIRLAEIKNRPGYWDRLSANTTGRTLSPEHCENLRIAELNRPPTTLQAYANMRKSQQKRRAENPVKEETKARTSASITAWHAARKAAGIPYSKRSISGELKRLAFALA